MRFAITLALIEPNIIIGITRRLECLYRTSRLRPAVFAVATVFAVAAILAVTAVLAVATVFTVTAVFAILTVILGIVAVAIAAATVSQKCRQKTQYQDAFYFHSSYPY